MTDCIINFNYSDDKHMVSIFVKSDMHLDTLTNELNNLLTELNHTRVSWNYLVPYLIYGFAKKYHPQYDGVKICQEYPHDGKKNPNTIFIVTLKPIEEKFKQQRLPLIECFWIKITTGVGTPKPIYDGTLVDLIENPIK